MTTISSGNEIWILIPRWQVYGAYDFRQLTGPLLPDASSVNSTPSAIVVLLLANAFEMPDLTCKPLTLKEDIGSVLGTVAMILTPLLWALVSKSR